MGDEYLTLQGPLGWGAEDTCVARPMHVPAKLPDENSPRKAGGSRDSCHCHSKTTDLHAPAPPSFVP